MLTGKLVPTVDVFITYCGEGVDVVLDTVRAACALDYPVQSFRVVVLDDSQSEELGKSIAKRRQRSKNLYYTSRGEEIKIHSKAANLNWGLKYAGNLEGGVAELLAVLDVDMIPEPNWLRTLIPHLFQSDRVAMVSPPQNYYNTSDDDRYGGGMWFIRLFDIVAPLMDRANNASCTGTGFVARRKAIDDIGGFPTQSIAEGVLTSWRLKSKGFQSVYVATQVQWGMGPQTIQSFVRQLQRFAGGAASLMEHLPRSQEGSSTLSQRLGSTMFLLTNALPACASALNMALVPLALVLGAPSTLIINDGKLRGVLTKLAMIDFITQLLYGFVLSSIASRRLHILHHLANLWVAPHQCMAILLALGFVGYGKKKREDHRTSGTQSKVEQKASGLASFSDRLRFALLDGAVLFHSSILGICVVGACASIYHAVTSSNEQAISTTSSHFIIQAGWPPFLTIWTAYVANAWIPISCAIFPPKRVPRQSLLVEHSDVDAAYPSLEAKQSWYQKPREWHLLSVVVYYLVFLISIRQI